MGANSEVNAMPKGKAKSERLRHVMIAAGFVLAFGIGAATACALEVDSPAPPTSPTSAMFSLEDIYNRVSTGAAGAKRTGAFTDPTTGPVATRHTLNDVMEKAPASDDANGAVASQVLVGKTYWSLLNNTWGQATGSMPNNGAVTITPGTVNQTISLGFHDGTGVVNGDVNLTAGNIKSGISIFGVAGSTSVVDTAGGTAVAGDLLSGKTAFVNGALVTGTVPAGANVTGGNGVVTFTIPNGLYVGNKTGTASDTNLVSGNIKSGVSVFGVSGTAIIATGNATGTDVVVGKTFSNATTAGVVGTRSPALVARTGQTTSYAAGDDGAILKGVPSPSPRFTDNANGTVTDNLTGLIWLKNANVFSKQTWPQALADCNTLANGSAGLTDGSTAGQWRLPNLKELHSLIDYSSNNPALPAGHPFTGVQSAYYWSSTTWVADITYAWVLSLGVGFVNNDTKASIYYVWPVKGGQ
jgi:hypothetical protein